MTLTNDDLLALAKIMDSRIQPMEKRMKNIEMLLEHDILPRLQNIESCYTSTYRRYSNEADNMEALKTDMEIVKKVVAEHSDKLQSLA